MTLFIIIVGGTLVLAVLSRIFIVRNVHLNRAMPMSDVDAAGPRSQMEADYIEPGNDFNYVGEGIFGENGNDFDPPPDRCIFFPSNPVANEPGGYDGCSGSAQPPRLNPA